MDRYRYFIFNQKGVLILGILQIACAGLCVICGFMDAVFRKSTPLSRSRTPLWGGLIMASPGVLALFASQRKNSILVSVMVGAAGLSGLASVVISGYCGLTLTYGEEDEDVFHHSNTPEVTFVLHRMVKGANSTIILTCVVSLFLSSLIAFVGCRSLPFCGCYDNRTGLETLVPQSDSGDTEMVCTWKAGGDDRIFNSPAQSVYRDSEEQQQEEAAVAAAAAAASRVTPYSRMA